MNPTIIRTPGCEDIIIIHESQRLAMAFHEELRLSLIPQVALTQCQCGARHACNPGWSGAKLSSCPECQPELHDARQHQREVASTHILQEPHGDALLSPGQRASLIAAVNEPELPYICPRCHTRTKATRCLKIFCNTTTVPCQEPSVSQTHWENCRCELPEEPAATGDRLDPGDRDGAFRND